MGYMGSKIRQLGLGHGIPHEGTEVTERRRHKGRIMVTWKGTSNQRSVISNRCSVWSVGLNERRCGWCGDVTISFYPYRVTNLVTHGFWKSARAGKGGRAGHFVHNAEDFGKFWVVEGGNKYFCGGGGSKVSALGAELIPLQIASVASQETGFSVCPTRGRAA